MDPKPFRCVYDPELSRSKLQGRKPLFTKVNPDLPSNDPRLGKTRSVGKRILPSVLPLPEFVKTSLKPAPRRCLIAGFSPLVPKFKLLDVVQQFGSVEECQISMSQTTGASLGVGHVIYDKKSSEAIQKLIDSNEQGQLSIDNHSNGLVVKLDEDGSLLKRAEQEAENQIISQFSQSHDISLTSDSTFELNRVELRSLTPAQVGAWYEKFIGPDATYVLIRDIFLPVKHFSHDDIAKAFRAFSYSQIAINKSGFYISFKDTDEAIECYTKMHRKSVYGVPVKLLVTLKGKRYSQEDMRELIDRRQRPNGIKDQNYRHSLDSPLNALKTLRPGQPVYSTQSQLVNKAAEQILSELGPHVKKAAWSEILENHVAHIVQRELEKMWKSEDEQAITHNNTISRSESELGSQNGDSKESTPALIKSEQVEKTVGFGARRGGTMGMAARAVPGYGKVRPWSHLPALKIRKRFSETQFTDIPRIKKRKPIQVTASAPNSYIRAPIDETIQSKKEIKEETEDEGSQMEVDEPDISERSEEPGDLKDESEKLVESETLFDEESDDESRGFDMPDIITPHTQSIDGYQSVQKFVTSLEDLEVLKQTIGLKEQDSPADDVIYSIYSDDFRPKLVPERVSWPPATQKFPFRLSPYRDRSDDERREYLPNLGPGIPNEIVQSYTERPLYEGFEDVEEEETRTDNRALNVSRSAFGVNSDLFADDNLSKNAKDTRLARSAIHDWGLYANESIPANDFVIEYVGDILRDEYAEVRERHYALEGIDSTYLFRLDNGTVIDATKRGNGARFINHSCDPNCTAQVFDYEGFKRVVLFSSREIEPDEELTFDYNFVKSQDEDGRVRCACGSANCRGWLM